MYPALLTNLGCGTQLRSHLKGFWIREQLFLEIPSLHLFNLDNQCEFIHSGSQFFLKRCPGFCTWWCPALRMSQHSFVSQSDWLVVPGCLSSLVSLHLFPNLAHGVRLFGCLPAHLSPSLTGWWCPAVCLHLSPYICFPVWWMCLFTCVPSFVSHSV